MQLSSIGCIDRQETNGIPSNQIQKRKETKMQRELLNFNHGIMKFETKTLRILNQKEGTETKGNSRNKSKETNYRKGNCAILTQTGDDLPRPMQQEQVAPTQPAQVA